MHFFDRWRTRDFVAMEVFPNTSKCRCILVTWKGIIGLTSAVSDKADTHSMCEVLGEFLFLYVGGMLQTFLPFKCTDLKKCIRELWITLYTNKTEHKRGILTISREEGGGGNAFLARSQNFEKASVSFVISVRLSTVCPHARIEQPGPHWTFIKFDVWMSVENLSRKFNFY